MINKNSEQLQVRIDTKTKNEAKIILEGLGMDMSSAVKIFLRQVIITRSFPFELRDENGFTLRNAEALRESIEQAKRSEKSFKSASALIKDALND
ncbi:MAG: type II toxin-antitoxin system RelB/DinJ family antitoxin [Candidatus Pacebacteria bacterium]|nr:type II toxin-antitoxin system RelB/DinJ family antitoxin [Candidatus Paceibacterota bacterium]